MFERWLYKSITGAISTARLFSTSSSTSIPFKCLEDKPFSTGYWLWQHRYLIDSVRQFGYPSLFITISPSEWTFPWPYMLQNISSNSGYGPTNLPFQESMHYVHTLEQVIRGYLWGSNNSKWKQHVFNYNNSSNQTNILNYFYRFEFQKRGTIHVHLLIWLKTQHMCN